MADSEHVPSSGRKDANWVSKTGGLPEFINRIAKDLMEKGMSESHAIATAVNQCKKWAAGGKDVKPQTRAKAAAAVAEWEAKKAASHVGLSVPARLDSGRHARLRTVDLSSVLERAAQIDDPAKRAAARLRVLDLAAGDGGAAVASGRSYSLDELATKRAKILQREAAKAARAKKAAGSRKTKKAAGKKSKFVAPPKRVKPVTAAAGGGAQWAHGWVPLNGAAKAQVKADPQKFAKMRKQQASAGRSVANLSSAAEPLLIDLADGQVAFNIEKVRDAYSAKQQKIRQRAYERQRQQRAADPLAESVPVADIAYRYPKEVWNTHLIVKGDNDANLFKVPYSVGSDGVTVTFGKEVPVTQQYVELSHADESGLIAEWDDAGDQIMTIDLADAKPGQRFRHGWIPINSSVGKAIRATAKPAARVPAPRVAGGRKRGLVDGLTKAQHSKRVEDLAAIPRSERTPEQHLAFVRSNAVIRGEAPPTRTILPTGPAKPTSLKDVKGEPFGVHTVRNPEGVPLHIPLDHKGEPVGKDAFIAGYASKDEAQRVANARRATLPARQTAGSTGGMTKTRTTADNPFAAHSQSVLEDFASGRMGAGPFHRNQAARDAGEEPWGTVEQAKAELAHRKQAAKDRRATTKKVASGDYRDQPTHVLKQIKRDHQTGVRPAQDPALLDTILADRAKRTRLESPSLQQAQTDRVRKATKSAMRPPEQGGVGASALPARQTAGSTGGMTDKAATHPHNTKIAELKSSLGNPAVDRQFDKLHTKRGQDLWPGLTPEQARYRSVQDHQLRTGAVTLGPNAKTPDWYTGPEPKRGPQGSTTPPAKGTYLPKAADAAPKPDKPWNEIHKDFKGVHTMPDGTKVRHVLELHPTQGTISRPWRDPAKTATPPLTENQGRVMPEGHSRGTFKALGIKHGDRIEVRKYDHAAGEIRTIKGTAVVKGTSIGVHDGVKEHGLGGTATKVIGRKTDAESTVWVERALRKNAASPTRERPKSAAELGIQTETPMADLHAMTDEQLQSLAADKSALFINQDRAKNILEDRRKTGNLGQVGKTAHPEKFKPGEKPPVHKFMNSERLQAIAAGSHPEHAAQAKAILQRRGHSTVPAPSNAERGQQSAQAMANARGGLSSKNEATRSMTERILAKRAEKAAPTSDAHVALANARARAGLPYAPNRSDAGTGPRRATEETVHGGPEAGDTTAPTARQQALAKPGKSGLATARTPVAAVEKQALLQRIVNDKSALEVGGVVVDMNSANIVNEVLKALSPSNRQKMLELPFHQMMERGMTLYGRVQKR